MFALSLSLPVSLSLSLFLSRFNVQCLSSFPFPLSLHPPLHAPLILSHFSLPSLFTVSLFTIPLATRRDPCSLDNLEVMIRDKLSQYAAGGRGCGIKSAFRFFDR
jgi:hypothetical protein